MRVFIQIALLLQLVTFIPSNPMLAATAADEAAQEAQTPAPARRPNLSCTFIFESGLGVVHFTHKLHQIMGCQ